jgi:hypothetical protein
VGWAHARSPIGECSSDAGRHRHVACGRCRGPATLFRNADRVAGRSRLKQKRARCNPARLCTELVQCFQSLSHLSNSVSSLAILNWWGGRTLRRGLGENTQNVDQVARGAGGCLCGSALNALAKSVSEFQENAFAARIAELRLRLRPFPDSTFRFENTAFHSPVPVRLVLLLHAELVSRSNSLSGTLVAERPDEQLAPNSPIFNALALYIAGARRSCRR